MKKPRKKRKSIWEVKSAQSRKIKVPKRQLRPRKLIICERRIVNIDHFI